MGATEDASALKDAEFIPFSAETRMSGVQHRRSHHHEGRGRRDSRSRTGIAAGGDRNRCQSHRRSGGTPLAIVDDDRPLGVIYLKDTVKPGMSERFAELRAMGIRTVMVTGDNKLTAATIAHEAGVDDFVAEAKPEDKIAAHPRLPG